MITPEAALLAAAALHLGFQATVTTVVYPALARVPADGWAAAHRAHTRAITPLVAVVYGTLGVTGAWALVTGPGGWTVVTLAAAAVAVLVTATVGAPVHGRLGAGRRPALFDRLLRADRLRLAAAAVAALAATLAAW